MNEKPTSGFLRSRWGYCARRWCAMAARTRPVGLSDLQLMPGARLGCEALRNAGYQLVMVTNQPDIATGLQNPPNGGPDEPVAANGTRARSGAGVPAPGKRWLRLPETRARNVDGCGRISEPRLGPQLHGWADRWRDVEAGNARGLPHGFYRLSLQRTAAGEPQLHGSPIS